MSYYFAATCSPNDSIFKSPAFDGCRYSVRYTGEARMFPSWALCIISHIRNDPKDDGNSRAAKAISELYSDWLHYKEVQETYWKEILEYENDKTGLISEPVQSHPKNISLIQCPKKEDLMGAKLALSGFECMGLMEMPAALEENPATSITGPSAQLFLNFEGHKLNLISL